MTLTASNWPPKNVAIQESKCDRWIAQSRSCDTDFIIRCYLVIRLKESLKWNESAENVFTIETSSFNWWFLRFFVVRGKVSKPTCLASDWNFVISQFFFVLFRGFKNSFLFLGEKFYENRFSLITVREKNEESMNEKLNSARHVCKWFKVIWCFCQAWSFVQDLKYSFLHHNCVFLTEIFKLFIFFQKFRWKFKI